ncbi:MAG: DUF4157 domain-containing protein [Nevskia sp.]|nr:DUF4157 domain-containing protein [Nevskia sp.]
MTASLARSIAPAAAARMQTARPCLQRQCACGAHTPAGATCQSCAGRETSASQHAGTAIAERGVPGGAAPPPSGQPLDRDTRSFMERRFGQDFSSVRVHTDDRAAAAAGSLNAAAYTVGDRIVFGRDRYAPGSRDGLHLLAHELSHVVQQSAGPSLQRRGLDQGREAALEQEADRAADAVLGAGMALPRLSRIGDGALQRQPADGSTSAQASQAAQPAQAAVRHDKQELKDAGRDGKRFDALLDRDQGVLAITMRVAFEFKNNPGPINEPWTDARKTQWKAEFIRANVARWSNRYVLVPDRPCATEPMSSVKVLIDIQEDGKNPHFHLTVDNERLPATSGISNLEREGHMHESDTTPSFHPDSGTRQTVGEHEFGHMLGAHHIHCNSNDKECYGLGPNPVPGEKEDVMGVGSEVSKRDYEVFAEVLQGMTGCNWKVDDDRSGLKVLGIVLGSLAGAAVIGLGIAAATGAFSKKGH